MQITWAVALTTAVGLIVMCRIAGASAGVCTKKSCSRSHLALLWFVYYTSPGKTKSFKLWNADYNFIEISAGECGGCLEDKKNN